MDGMNRAAPPMWLVVATGIWTLTCLVLAIAETNLWIHYLIDQGESWSLCGLAFILVAGIYLYRRRRLFVSLPLVFPWLLYPVITQGDQLIDNLSMGWMRFVCQVLLAAIFGAPVAVLVLAARYLLTPRPNKPTVRIRWLEWFPGLRALAEGRTREGTGLLSAALLVIEVWVAQVYLGTLMVVTLMGMALATLVYVSLRPPEGSKERAINRERAERFALFTLLIGVVVSLGLFIGYKNRPGAYQGSPSTYMDPKQKGHGYSFEKIAIPVRPPATPVNSDAVRDALAAYAETFKELLSGYHLLDRNYTYDFHNELFIRHTPLVTDYRDVGLGRIAKARELWGKADALGMAARDGLAQDDPLSALLDELHNYAAYNFGRAPTLETMSAYFQRTKAGLQHCAHLYEGEGKAFSEGLERILQKHQSVLKSRATAPVTAQFATTAYEIYEAYADHVVGF